MSWDAVGAIAELAGAVGVMASLVYLATQIGHNTRASAVEAKLTTTGMLSGFVDMLITAPELNELFMRGRDSTRDLSPEEFQRFSNMVMKTFWFCSAAHFQLRTGTLSEEDWFEIKAILDFWIAGEGVREWWHRYGHQRFAKVFAEYIDTEVARVEASTTADSKAEPSGTRIAER
jgi:hypothetical protein